MSDFIIQVNGLQKNFGNKQAINNLSFEIPENTITGLIGRNGSGKTTLMKLLCGQLEKTNGSILVFGGEPMDNIRVLSRTVYTYHNFNYHKALRLKTIILNYADMFPEFDKEFANKLMKYFELNGKMKYSALSQGMASIFNFLCALACRSPLTMMDEPVLGMDVAVRKAAYEILIREFAEHPRTFIISSHLLNELEGVLSDLLLIENGQKVLHKEMDEIRGSAYRVDGDKNRIDEFTSGRNVIARKDGALQSFAVVYEPVTDEVNAAALQMGLQLSSVKTEDLCVYLIKQDKEDELECLW